MNLPSFLISKKKPMGKQHTPKAGLKKIAPRKTTPRKKDDSLLKGAFQETFPDLLRFHYPKADTVFDFERGFEFLDKELAELFPERQKPGGTRFVDMLVKAFLKDATEKWILLHIEIQGGRPQKFAFRMLQYWYRVFDRYQVDVSALAVFTGDKGQKKARPLP